jgi:hypothetical protein
MNDQSRLLVRAATGPIILITVGTLFALEKFTPYRFGQTWPVLLIIIGFLRLLGGGNPRCARRLRNAPPAHAPGQPTTAPNPFPPIPPQGRPGWQPAPPPPPPPPPYRSASEPMPDMTPPPPPRPGERR